MTGRRRGKVDLKSQARLKTREEPADRQAGEEATGRKANRRVKKGTGIFNPANSNSNDHRIAD